MRSRWTIVIVAVCLVAAVAGGFTTGCRAGQAGGNAPEVLRAQRFELVDANGEKRGELAMALPGGFPNLALYDEQGELRVMLGVDFDGPALALCDENGNPRASLALSADDDGGGLALADEKGELRVAVGLVSDGRPILRLYDGDSTERVMLYLDPDGGPFLGLCDENGEIIWRAP